MFKDHDIDDIELVVEQLITVINTVHIAKSRSDLECLCATKNKTKKDIIDTVLSMALQYNQKIPTARYNMIRPTASDLVTLDSLFIKFNSEVFYKLPFLLQRLFLLSTNKSLYRTNDSTLRRLITRWYGLPQEEVLDNKCKRCYTITEDIICDTCKAKIESCVEYRCTSFSTSGTTIEPFEYTFKDWYVKVTNYGEYKLTKLNKNTGSRYQPKLPYEEYQNNLNLIG